MELREHVDSADAKGREDTDASISTLRTDIARAEQAQAAAYERAIAEGRSQAEAMAAGLLAKLDTHRQASDQATGQAAAKAQEALNAAVTRAQEAEAKAVEKATENLKAAEQRLADARVAQSKEIADAKAKAEEARDDGTPLGVTLGGGAGLLGLVFLLIRRAIGAQKVRWGVVSFVTAGIAAVVTALLTKWMGA